MTRRKNNWRPSYYPMGVESSMYPPTTFIPQPQSVDDIDDIIKWAEETKDRWMKKVEEGKKDDKKKEPPKPKTFSFLEVLGIVTILGPIIVGIEAWFFFQLFGSLIAGK